MKILPYALVHGLIFLASSCGSNQDSVEEMSASPNDTVTDSIPVIAQPTNSPAGWVLAERFASNDNEYRFCPDGTLMFDNHFGLEMDGTWRLVNDSLILTYTRRISKIGIGEPLPPPPVMPGNYQTQYETYEEKIEKMLEEQVLFWSEITEHLNQDSLYPYQIIERGIDCK